MKTPLHHPLPTTVLLAGLWMTEEAAGDQCWIVCGCVSNGGDGIAVVALPGSHRFPK